MAFPRAKDAVSAAAEIQRALAGHSWPDGVELRVRIGLHTGEAHSTGERYIGLSVNRAARISAVGHGGQVLLSQTTANYVEDDIDHLDGLSLKDLGERQLKDIARPVRIYQLDVDGLRKQFPPLKAQRPSDGGDRGGWRCSRHRSWRSGSRQRCSSAVRTRARRRCAGQPRALRPRDPRADGRHQGWGRA